MSHLREPTFQTPFAKGKSNLHFRKLLPEKCSTDPNMFPNSISESVFLMYYSILRNLAITVWLKINIRLLLRFAISKVQLL